MSFETDHLDHLVLTVRDIEITCDFYQRVMGMTPVTFGEGRRALHFGNQKINLHPLESGIGLVARNPLPGSADLCFITLTPLAEVITHLNACHIPIEAGPVARTGAVGTLESVYFRDPDENLIELSIYR